MASLRLLGNGAIINTLNTAIVWMGWGIGGLWLIAAYQPTLRIVPWPPTFALSGMASNSSRVIPANNSLHTQPET